MSQKPVTGLLIDGALNQDQGKLIQKALENQPFISNKKSKTGRLITFEPSSHMPLDPTIYLKEAIQDMVSLINGLVPHVDRYLVVTENDIDPLYLLFLKATKKPFTVLVDTHVLTDAQMADLIRNDKTLRQRFEKRIHNNLPIETLKTPNGGQLRPYQQQMVDFALEKKRCGLFADMGLGKTLATLAFLNELFTKDLVDKTKPILIVAPITVALDTWSREADDWGYDFDVKINIQLSVKKRNALLESLIVPQEKPTLVTTNPEQLGKIADFYDKRGWSYPFEVVIIDELSMFKAHDTNKFVDVQKLTKNIRYFVGLTGTPSPSSYLNLWSQLIVIDPANMRYFTSDFYIYRSTYFKPTSVHPRTGRVFKYGLKPGAKEKIFENLKHTVMALKTDGRVDLPSITYVNKYIKLPAKAKKIYNDFDKKLRKILRDTDQATSMHGIKIANSAVLKMKLLQLSSGAIYDNIEDFDPSIISDDFSMDVKERHYTSYHDKKLEAIKEMVETATSPLLIFFWFKSEAERLKKFKIDYVYLDPKAKNFSDIITKWNKGEIPVLLVHPASAAHGLNIQKGGHTIIWMTPPNSNERYRQANKRLHRSGQKHPVTVIHLLAEGTEDIKVINNLNKQEDDQQELMTALDPNAPKT